MALSIKSEEAHKLARDLATLTGETMTHAVTVALKERLKRVRAAQAAQGGLAARLLAFAEGVSGHFDGPPITRAEWDWACGDED